MIGLILDAAAELATRWLAKYEHLGQRLFPPAPPLFVAEAARTGRRVVPTATMRLYGSLESCNTPYHRHLTGARGLYTSYSGAAGYDPSADRESVGAPGAGMLPTVDPVCGTPVSTAGNQNQAEYADRTYYFCSSACMERFNEEADMFISRPAAGSVANNDRGIRDGDISSEPPVPSEAKLMQPDVGPGPG